MRFLADSAPAIDVPFPVPIPLYGSEEGKSLPYILFQRIHDEPFNLVATIIFFCAILHTLACPLILRAAKRQQELHEKELEVMEGWGENVGNQDRLSPVAAVLHFMGEVEMIFALWAIPLMCSLMIIKKPSVAIDYLNKPGITDYTQPLFVVVAMVIASSRPILQTVSGLMSTMAGDSAVRWWWVLLTAGPLLGSFITEPAAMTVCALLLAREFYRLEPSTHFSYATLALLFTNISVGGALTSFAAAPIIMVHTQWDWSTPYIFGVFGIKAIAAITAANTAYFFMYRGEFKRMEQTRRKLPADISERQMRAPLWIVAVHLAFLVWTVLVNRDAPLFLGGFLFYVGFLNTTAVHQDELNLRPALLVGMFLCGLIIHAGLQGWWLEPVIGHMQVGFSLIDSYLLLIVSTILTAFNDNALITLLGTTVPAAQMGDALKYQLVAGAICGGGLTVIANAPNPAGQTLLQKYFPGGIEPLHLLIAAAIPTAIMVAFFAIL